VVIEEIESWYLAGLDERGSALLGLPDFGTTDTVTKEDFIALTPERFDSRIDLMIDILKIFSVTVAQRKNRSFGYFFSRHLRSTEASS
jgi:hypothetical protein